MKHQPAVFSTILAFVALLPSVGAPVDAPALSVPRYAVTDLDTLPDAENSYACGINDAGQIIGYTNRSERSGFHAFLWENGKMQDIGTPGGEKEKIESLLPLAINSSGQALVECQTLDPHPPKERRLRFSGQGPPILNHPYLYWHGQWTPIFSQSSDSLETRGMNDESQVVGQSAQCFLWKHGIVTPFPIGSEQGYVTGINNWGQVIGNRATPQGFYEGFLFDKGKRLDLGTLPPYQCTEASAVNDRAQVAGYAWSGVIVKGLPDTMAFVWSRGVLRKLDGLPNYTATTTKAINHLGQIVGSAETPTGVQIQWPTHAVCWNERKIQDLNGAIDPKSGWVLLAAESINNKGQIVGNGVHNGKGHAFLLTPIKP